VPADQPTIQAAIDVANNGDTVLVAPGTYSENINFKGKAITITSESGPEVTFIDGRNVDPVVSFISGERRDSAINGFTLQNGRADYSNERALDGGGVRVLRSSPTITNNVITNNHACYGGGIGSRAGSPLIQMNTITGNNAIDTCFGGGAGISIEGNDSAASRTEILDNMISDNVSSRAGGGISISGTAIVKRNIIKGNRVELESEEGQGGGILAGGSYVLIVQNLITGNHASIGGGIHWNTDQGLAGPIVVNNTIADNDAPLMGSGVFADGYDGLAELTNNIIVAKPGQAALHCGDRAGTSDPIIRFNNMYSVGGKAYGGSCLDITGTNGNTSFDPLFVNPTQGDYHLQPGSFSIDAGDNQAPNLPDKDLGGDPRIMDGEGDGTATIDMGADEFLLPPGFTLPTSRIAFPTEGRIVLIGKAIAITGLARDTGGGTVARVDVSVDDGVTWSAATGTGAWRYNWTPVTLGPVTIRSRAVDDGGNQQDPPATVTGAVAAPIRVPSDQPTIQAAIDAANNGYTVLVAPGTYHEHIDFKGKAITVTSESGPQNTTIDADNTHPVASFTSGEGRDSILNGFTLQNGRTYTGGEGAPPQGGGVVITHSSPTITNNVIMNNQSSRGGGIGISWGSPLIQLNKITNNISPGGSGGGILITGDGTAEILDNVISNNRGGSGGGIYIPGAEAPIIKRNIIKGNIGGQTGLGGGVYAIVSKALIAQNVITGNETTYGAGIYLSVGDSAVLVNNTIADNNAVNASGYNSDGSGIYVDGSAGVIELTNNIIVAKPNQSAFHCSILYPPTPPVIRYNNIFSPTGSAYGGSCSGMTGTNGNISADPLFTNPTQGDYHLQLGSLSIDTGDNSSPNLPFTDLDEHPRIQDGDGDGNEIIDMGVYEFPALPSSDGKSPEESVGLNLRLFAAPPATSKPLAPNLRLDRRRLKCPSH
jgi:hypothetical protein